MSSREKELKTELDLEACFPAKTLIKGSGNGHRRDDRRRGGDITRGLNILRRPYNEWGRDDEVSSEYRIRESHIGIGWFDIKGDERGGHDPVCINRTIYVCGGVFGPYTVVSPSGMRTTIWVQFKANFSLELQ